jgi:hypothetical protein
MEGLLTLTVAAVLLWWFIRQFNETNSKKWYRRLRPTGYFLGALARNVAADVRALRRLPMEWRHSRSIGKGMR